MHKRELIVKPTTARLTRDTQTFGRMDPYIIFKIGGAQQKTKTHEAGGKTPNWSDIMSFTITDETELAIRVLDEEVVSDDIIGETRISLEQVIKNGQWKDWVDIHYENEPAGQVYLELIYSGPEQEKRQQQPGNAAPAAPKQTTTTTTYTYAPQPGTMPAMMPQGQGMMPQGMP
jgi:Ca2+-dependent lipid-binding protein